MTDFRTAERRAQRIKFYNHSVWSKIRKIQLSKEPLCRICRSNGSLTPANTCDHIDPLWETWNEFIRGPFQSLCRDCHDAKTRDDDIPKLLKRDKLKERFF